MNKLNGLAKDFAIILALFLGVALLIKYPLRTIGGWLVLKSFDYAPWRNLVVKTFKAIWFGFLVVVLNIRDLAKLLIDVAAKWWPLYVILKLVK